ncbi:MAG: nicotinamide-nucleotide amidohydrolase family protein [Candidatus Nanopelagicales bacterium]
MRSDPGSQSRPGPEQVADAAVAEINDGDVLPEADPVALIHRLVRIGRTVAVAESLTGGLVLAALTSVPGASAVVRGGVVAYAEELKTSLLGVEPEQLRRESAVSPGVALQMARGCRTLMGADYGVSTTGEAGPDSASGQPVGTFYVAVSGPQGDGLCRGRGAGGRAQVRESAVEAALALLDGTVADDAAGIGTVLDGSAPDVSPPARSRSTGHGNTHAAS